MKQKIVYFLLFVFITLSGCSSVQTQTCNLEKYGLKANRTENASPVLAGALFEELNIMEYECERYVVPTFKDAEFLIPVKELSMYPKYTPETLLLVNEYL